MIRVARWLHSTIPREGVDNPGGEENNGKQPCASDCHHGILPLPNFYNVEDRSEVDLVKEGTDHTCSEITQTRKSRASTKYLRREEVTRINCMYFSIHAIGFNLRYINKRDRNQMKVTTGSSLWNGTTISYDVGGIKYSKKKRWCEIQKPCLGRAENERVSRGGTRTPRRESNPSGGTPNT